MKKHDISKFLPEEAAAVLADAALRAVDAGPPGSRRREGVLNEAIAYVYAKWPARFRPEAREELTRNLKTRNQNGTNRQ